MQAKFQACYKLCSFKRFPRQTFQPRRFAPSSQRNGVTVWAARGAATQDLNTREASEDVNEKAAATAASPSDEIELTDGIPANRDRYPSEEELNNAKLWWAAIKLPMFSVGFIPVLVAAAAVFWQTGQVAGTGVASLFFGAVAVIAWLNLSNDAFDATTGVDKTKAESFVNLTGNRVGVLTTSFAFLALGVALLLLPIACCGRWEPAAMLAASIACGYVYQGPPFRLSYKGLGEPLCFWAFGPSATTAFYLALLPPDQSIVVPPLLWLLSVIVGITTTVILFCSHWHQIEGDRATGKMSPLVKLGSTARALPILLLSTLVPYVLLLGASLAGLAPWSLLACFAFSWPAARNMLGFAFSNYRTAEAIRPLKIYGTKYHIATGMCAVLGLVVSRVAGIA